MTTEVREPEQHPQHDFATKEQAAIGHQHIIGQKCDACGDAPSLWQFAGGALSFEDVDRYNKAAVVEGAVNGEMSVFDAILSNIRVSDLDAVAKASRIQAAASQLEARLREARARAEEYGDKAVPEDAVTTDTGGVFAWKGLDGNYRWMTIHTNKYEDREGEIFPEAAHKEYVDWVWETKQFPVLRLWHIPVNMGKADWIDYDDKGFVVASGTFLPGWEDVGERLAQMKGLGCSHGYIYRRSAKQNGVYNGYKTYEITVMPRNRAANMLTATFAGEEMPMLTPERKEFLESVIGADRVALVENTLGNMKALADESGLSYKALEEGIMELGTGTKDDAPVVTPEAAAAPAAAVAPTEPVVPVVIESAASVAPTEPVVAAAPAEPVVEPASTAPTPTVEEQAEAAAAAAQAAPLIEESDQAKGLKEVLGQVLAPLMQRIEDMGQEIAQLKESRDSSIASAFMPRIGMPMGTPASTSPANVVGEPEGVKEATPTGVPEGTPQVLVPHVLALQELMNGVGR